MSVLGRWVLLIALVVVTVGLVPVFVDVAFTATGALTSVILLVLCGLWLVVSVLSAWWIVFSIELTDTEVHWHTPLRKGKVPNDSIAEIRPVPVLALGGVHRVRTTDGSSFWVMVSRGFHELIEDVKEAGSEPDIRYSKAVGRVERMPGKNQYRRLTDPPPPRRGFRR
jgi:hypothetical protein